MYYYFKDTIMKNIKLKDAKNSFETLLKSCLFDDELVNIRSDIGNVVLMSGDHYRSIFESIYIFNCKEILNDIEEAKRTPSNELILKAPWEK